jgi:hypothetical protein
LPRLFSWVRIAVSAIAPLLRAFSLQVLCAIYRFEFVRFRCDDSAIVPFGDETVSPETDFLTPDAIDFFQSESPLARHDTLLALSEGCCPIEDVEADAARAVFAEDARLQLVAFFLDRLLSIVSDALSNFCGRVHSHLRHRNSPSGRHQARTQ